VHNVGKVSARDSQPQTDVVRSGEGQPEDSGRDMTIDTLIAVRRSENLQDPLRVQHGVSRTSLGHVSKIDKWHVDHSSFPCHPLPNTGTVLLRRPG
jgi:hypothetical protein